MSNKYPGGIITSGANAGYSVFFDGTGDYLTVANNTALQMGTGDFQVEAWVYTTNASAFQSIICIGISTGGSTAGTFTLRVQNDLKVRWCINDNSTGLTSTNAITVNTWTHVCVSRVSGTTRIFLNGVSNGSLSDSTNYNNTSGTMIGAENQSGAVNTMYGYISNLRVVKGSGVTSLNVPTQLVNISGTSLLTCNSPAIVDQSSNNFTITTNGNAAPSTFTPFQGYVAYNPALGAATPGIWTVSDAIQAAQTRRWNMYDPYFNLTTLLLHGNGTNGAQNNTFLDSSSNNFTITRNGNTTQGTFSPFSQTGWSNYFDGSASYRLTIPDSTDLDLTGDFCLEGWFYFTSFSTAAQMVCIGSENAAQNGFVVYISNSNGTCSFYSNGATVLNSSAVFTTNEWQHVAVVRSGSGSNNLVIYRNGVSVGAATNTTSFTGLAGNGLCIGQTYSTSYVGTLSAYVSNVRLVKGSPVYTGSFTPSTTPLTPITNTVLLTCQSNRFIDTNTQVAAKTITVTGSPSVQAFSPFYPLVAYTPQAQGGSGYFDGSGDYLLLPSGSTSTITANADFTFECWTYLTGYPNTYNAIFGGTTNDWTLSYNSTNGIYLAKVGSPIFCETTGTSGTWTMASMLNSWNHIAVTRSGNSWTIWINGVSRATATQSQSYTNSQKAFFGEGGNLNTGQGYLSGARYTTAALYSSTFTPPTAPPTTTVSSGTCQLLCNFTNAGVLNSTADSVVETVNTAQISTAQSKFGGSSLYFDGTNNTSRLRALGQPYNLYSGNFTVEFWYYPTAHNTTGYPVLWTNYETWIGGAGYNNLIGLLAGNKDRSPVNAIYLTLGDNFWSPTTTVPSLNTWTHVALVRTGNRYLIFINGVKEVDYAAVSTITFNSNSLSIVGGGTDGAGLNRIYGYIDDFRQTNYARYTGNFTPQTSQWQDQ
jgi:hypothetical protein